MRKKAILCLALCCCTAGCRDEKIIEQLGFIRTIAFDTGSTNKNGKQLRVTISIPKAEPPKESIVLTSEAATSKEARSTFARENNRQVVSGQLQTVLFGEVLSQKGLWQHVDTLIRDPAIGNKVSLAVVEGDANQLLQREYAQYPSTGDYIENLIRSAYRTNEIPYSNLYTFTRDYFDKGIDPITPLVRAYKNAIRISGLALFREDRYVGKIESRNSLLFASLIGPVKAGDLSIPVPDGDGEGSDIVFMSFISSKRKVTVNAVHPIKSGSDLSVTIKLKIRGSLLEYSGKQNVQDSKVQRKLETQMNAYLEKEALTMIKNMQLLGADSMGIGQYARNKMGYAQWKEVDWHAFYSQTPIKVVVDMKIKDVGKVQE
ncbi:Ger(x)C family spore germination protein [Paenibacillus nasutitermitis]|uniref:Ger(X)C family spore germination protein n=1 Tax=Paenibacillus nasutitermitis TaxID=1652958 RepID=A0A916ZH15_9BACL|nr:Ger(x)C family spore germination protein [Paenibacillus nasutitermitis]GGD95285.1 hypothetical protein GCM10010911_62500 [Paenibacillus nasutitermitis]